MTASTFEEIPRFIPRIRTEALKGRQQDTGTVWTLREQVATAVRHQIDRLQAYRKEDRLRWNFLRRRLAPLSA